MIREEKRGRERLYRLEPEALRKVADWTEGHHAFWQLNLDNLKQCLEGNS